MTTKERAPRYSSHAENKKTQSQGTPGRHRNSLMLWTYAVDGDNEYPTAKNYASDSDSVIQID